MSRARAVLTGLALFLCTTQPPLAQESGTRIDYREDRVQRGDIPVATPRAEAPDLRTLWFLVNSGQREAAKEEQQRLRRAYPDWKTPADLLAALNPGPAPGGDAYGQRMQSIAALDGQSLLRYPAQALIEAADAARERDDGENLHMLAWRHLQRDEADRALTLFQASEAAGHDRDIQGLLAAYRALARTADRADDIDGLAALSREVQALGGADLLLARAWAARERGDLARAAERFRAALPAAEAREGLALVRHEQGDTLAARDLACDAAADSERLTRLCQGWLEEALAAAYEAGDYGRALRLFAEREAMTPPPSRALRELAAWSHAERDETDAAAARFSSLLDETPGDERLGLALVALLQEDTDRLRAAAQRYPGVAQELRRRAGQIALARKQFDLAARLEADARLAQRGRPALALEGSRRGRSGERGLGQLRHERAALTASTMAGAWRLGTSLSWNAFDSGLAAPDAPLGSRPGVDQRSPLTSVEDPATHLFARRESEDLSLYARLGRDLWQQPAGDAWTGLLQATLHHDPVTTQVELFREPIADSLLSRTGIPDPIDGGTWGGVMDAGVALRSTWSSASDWHLSLSGAASRQSGDEVDENHALSARIDLRSGWPGQHWSQHLDYWQLGPFASWRSFDDNQFVFTRGSGGYFSPQEEIRIGLASELLSAEGRRWQVRAGVELAWTDITEDPTRSTPRQRTRGVNVDARLEGHWLLSPHWQLGSQLQATDARGFRGSYAGLTLRWFPDARRAVWSREFSSDHRSR
jgi:hypothetical protein